MSDLYAYCILIALYALGFIVGVAVLRRKWQMIAGLMVAVILALPYLVSLAYFHFHDWFVVDVLNFKGGSYSPIIASLLLKAPIWIACGMTAGIVNRLVNNGFGKRQATRGRIIPVFYGIMICALGLTGVLFYDYSIFSRSQPARPECLKAELYLGLSGKKLKIPANPVMVIHTGSNTVWTLYASLLPQHMRELCNRASSLDKPLAVTDLIFVFQVVDNFEKYKVAALADRLCGDGQDAGGKLLCEAATYKSTVSRTILFIEYQLPNLYIDTKPHPSSAFAAARDVAARDGKPWTATQSGLFDKYPDGYYVAHGSELPGIDADPAVVHCTNDPTTQGSLQCTTARSLPGGMIGTVTFATRPADLDQTALAADQAVVELLQDLAAK